MKEMTNEELMTYEKMLTTICNRYLVAARSYDGTMRDQKAHNIWQKYNSIHERVMDEIEKRINNIEWK